MAIKMIKRLKVFKVTIRTGRPSLALAMFALCGCATSPPPVASDLSDLNVAVPDAWTTGKSSSGAPARAWWSEIATPRLAGLIAEVVQENHDLQAALARVDARAAEARIATADSLPQAALNFSASRTKRNFVGFPFGGPGGGSGVPTSRSNLHSVGIDISWEIDLWGRVRAGHQAAIADWQSAAADYHGARLSLEAQTARLWYQIVEAGRQLALAEATRDSFQSTLDQVRDRYDRGLRPALDVRLARAQLAAADGTVEERTRMLRRLKRQLEILLGRYPAALIETAAEIPGSLAPAPAGLPAELLGRRPDLAALERRVAAARSRVQAALAALLPRISLTASGGTSSEELKDLVDRDFSVWQLAANLMQPLFQGGRLRANVRVAEARAREAKASYVTGALRALSEVENALSAEELLARREAALEESARESRAAAELARERYARGLERFVTVLESQRRAFVAESDLLLVRRLRIEARIDLHLSLGGGFTAETLRTPKRKGGTTAGRGRPPPVPTSPSPD